MEKCSNNPVYNDLIELITKSNNYTSLYLFLSSNGTMTYNLKYLFPQLQIKLVLSKTEKLCNVKSINSKYSSLFGKEIDLFFNNKQPSETLVYREIDFYTNKGNSEETILNGISYWDNDIYNEIMGDEENSAIGLVMMKNKIEFFKTMEFLEQDCEREFINDYNFIRMIKFYIKGKGACLLFEVIKINNVIDKFGFFINSNIDSTDDDLIYNKKSIVDGYYTKKDFYDIIISSIQKKYKSICSLIE